MISNKKPEPPTNIGILLFFPNFLNFFRYHMAVLTYRDAFGLINYIKKMVRVLNGSPIGLCCSNRNGS